MKMKKRVIALSLAVAAMLGGGASAFAGTPISSSELPEAALKFLAKHFPGEQIRKAEVERGFRGMEYEVDLTSGAEVDFRDNGDWKEIKAAHGRTVPDALIPKGIAKYVAEQYPDLTIVELKRLRGGYEVELSNDIDLYLTEAGAPMNRGTRGSGFNKEEHRRRRPN